MSDLKILALDIEVLPARVWTYDLWQPIISYKQIIEPSRIMCFSAQWDGQRKVMFYSEHHDGYEGMMKALWDLMDEADVVLGYNTKKFDVPWILGAFMADGHPAPSPVKHIDLYQVVRSNTRFLSRKLDYVSQVVLDDKKIDVNTMILAMECVSEDEKVREAAWRKMKRYSIKDTKLMLPLFREIRSYVKMPHQISDDPYSCHSCGSTDLQRRGTVKTLVSEYQRLRCNACGSWFRETKRTSTSEIRAI